MIPHFNMRKIRRKLGQGAAVPVVRPVPISPLVHPRDPPHFQGAAAPGSVTEFNPLRIEYSTLGLVSALEVAKGLVLVNSFPESEMLNDNKEKQKRMRNGNASC